MGKTKGFIRKYIQQYEKEQTEISKKNDMEIKIKQEKAKNTNYVRCSHCGSDNLISEKHGVCKYCRRTLENVNFKD